MKVIIAGCRDFTNYALLKEKCDAILCRQTDIEIISGGCSTGKLTFVRPDKTEVYGADGLGEKYAAEKGYRVRIFDADWSLGVFAGPLRNAEMAVHCDALIAFHDGRSKGTADMIKKATELRRKVRVINFAEPAAEERKRKREIKKQTI